MFFRTCGVSSACRPGKPAGNDATRRVAIPVRESGSWPVDLHTLGGDATQYFVSMVRGVFHICCVATISILLPPCLIG